MSKTYKHWGGSRRLLIPLAAAIALSQALFLADISKSAPFSYYSGRSTVPQYSVTASSTQAGSSPVITTTLTGFPDRLSRMIVLMPPGLASSPFAVSKCSSKSFYKRDRKKFIGGIWARGLKGTHCSPSARIGANSLKGSGDAAFKRLGSNGLVRVPTSHLVGHGITSLGWPLGVVVGFTNPWLLVGILGGGEVISTVLSIPGSESSILKKDQLNNVGGPMYLGQSNNEDAGIPNDPPGSLDVKAKLYLLVDAIPNRALGSRFLARIGMPLGKLWAKPYEIPERFIKIGCNSYFLGSIGRTMIDCNMSAAKKYMWLPTSMSIAIDGSKGLEQGRPLIRLPTACPDQPLAVDAWFFDDGKPMYGGGDRLHSGPVAEENAGTSFRAALPVTGCASLQFRPSFQIALADPSPNAVTETTVLIRPRLQDADIRKIRIEFPAGLRIAQPRNFTPCPERNFDADLGDSCQRAQVGTAELRSTMVPTAGNAPLMQGPVVIFPRNRDEAMRFGIGYRGFTSMAVKGAITYGYDRYGELRQVAEIEFPYPAPYSESKVTLSGGSRGIMQTPERCGRYPYSATLTSFAGHQYTVNGRFDINRNCR